MNKTFLLDDIFLEDLNNQPQRELWVKILALTIDEEPVEEITGRITGGSISVDGSSKMRRSCSLSMISDRLNVNEYLWGLNTKVKISIGITNKVNPLKYGDIVWFPQGTYVLNSFNISINNQSSTISLQGKDKMSLLNGDLGGNLTALTYAFDTVQEENGYDSYYTKKLPLHYIIREAVHTFANEPYHNIIINDLDDWGLELLTYRGEEPMYFIYDPSADDIINMTINPKQIYYFEMPGSKERVERTIEALEIQDGFEFKVLNDFVSQGGDGGTIVYTEKEKDKGKAVQLIKIEYGMTCGYRITDLVYPKDLTLNVGEGLTAMLDKLVSMLGNFEYFYNLEGQFVFQKKQTYVHTSWNNLTDNDEEQWADHTAYTASHVYSLYNSKLVSSFSNAPALNNVKNDFSIWGVRKGVTGIEMPIHMRYAIDKKPEYYQNIAGQIYVTSKDVFNKLKEDAKIKVLNTVMDRIQKFQLNYPSAYGLPAPQKQPDGSWTPGWWDIRDWHDYYYALTLSEPRYTMKWYSKNSIEGCVPANSLSVNYTYNLGANNYVWLLIFNPNTGKYNPQHGSGNPNSSSSLRTLYESYFDNAGTLVTKQVKDENGNLIKEYFIPPFSGCSDNHTYLEFLVNDIGKQKNLVYFYNPEFPEYSSFDELVQDQIDKEYQEYLDKGMLNLVDWREIIYQMAKDHNKYGNMDNANPKSQLVKVNELASGKEVIVTQYDVDTNEDKYNQDSARSISLVTAVRELNSVFYPTGYTGYEQYYIDILGFWRNIYNPEYECSYEIEPMTRLEYEGLQEENKVFYDAPVYKQCTEDSIYYDDIDYYTCENEVYTKVMLTKSQFNGNKTAYYYINDVKKEPVPIDIKNFEFNKTYYKTDNHSDFITINKDNINTVKPQDYSIRHEKIQEMLLFKFDAFHPAYLFNTYDPVANIYRPLTQGITKGDYLARPWVYYRNKSGKQTCCTSINIPAPAGRGESCWFANSKKIEIKTYTPMENCPYALAWSHGESVELNKDITNEVLKDICINATRSDDSLAFQKANMPWYYCYKTYTYEPLIKPAIPYDPHGTYYLKSDILEFNKKDSENEYWKYDFITNPESLIFWFDFLDTDGELSNYSIPRIGDRPKAVNDKDVKAIYFRETPGIIFLQPDEWELYTDGKNVLDKPTGYSYAQLPFYLQHLFAISSQGKSAKDVLDEYLYQYSYCTENVTISALPIYHLEPNTRILIRDDKSHINGEYIINKMTIPLDPKGSMSINAVKAIDRLY